MVPIVYYPWVVLYRKSVFQEKGYTVPTTWDEFETLCTKMQADGLIPLAFADKDGWPAMGTFDILNMRMNGYEFHVDLLAGKEKWTDPRVTGRLQEVERDPALPPARLRPDRKWEDAAGVAGPTRRPACIPGPFVSNAVRMPAENLADVDFFPFPSSGTPYDAEKGIDAPIDGFMISARRRGRTSQPPRRCSSACDPERPGPFLAKDPARSRQPTTPTRARTPSARRRWPRSSGRPEVSPSSSTAILGSDFAGAQGMQAFLRTSSRIRPRTSPLHGQDPGRLRLTSRRRLAIR